MWVHFDVLVDLDSVRPMGVLFSPELCQLVCVQLETITKIPPQSFPISTSTVYDYMFEASGMWGE